MMIEVLVSVIVVCASNSDKFILLQNLLNVNLRKCKRNLAVCAEKYAEFKGGEGDVRNSQH